MERWKAWYGRCATSPDDRPEWWAVSKPGLGDTEMLVVFGHKGEVHSIFSCSLCMSFWVRSRYGPCNRFGRKNHRTPELGTHTFVGSEGFVIASRRNSIYKAVNLDEREEVHTLPRVSFAVHIDPEVIRIEHSEW